MRRFTALSVLSAATLAAVVVSRPEPAFTHKPITTNILFKNEIAQIFQRKCFQCHSENNVSFPLTTYTEARPWARAIREEILDREMPPWQAAPGYGHFANDVGLTTREKEIILSWTDGGAPSGVLKAEESIPPVFVPTTPSWDHGEPDHVFAIGDGHAVAAYAPLHVARFVVDTRLQAATRVHAIALKQGDRRVVRYAAFFDEASGAFLGAWTPWQTTWRLADHISLALPARARVAVEIGYAGTETDVTDRSELGLYLERDGASPAATMTLSSPDVSLAAGVTNQRVRVEQTLAAETSIVALWPDVSGGARSIELTATRPEGMMTPLLWVPQYRGEWRAPYVMSGAVTLPRGTRLAMTAYFDNPDASSSTARARMWLMTAAPAAASSRQQR